MRRLGREYAGSLRAGLTALALTATASAYAGDDKRAEEAARFNETDGYGSFARSVPDIAASFDSLSPQEQARVIRRCRSMMAKPAEADIDQLAVCQTVMAMGKR